MAAWNPDQYYPQRPGGPYLSTADNPAVPRVRHSAFDTEAVLADRVRRHGIFQGLNEQQLQGYIQDEINYAHTNAIGFRSDYAGDAVNRSQGTFDGQSA